MLDKHSSILVTGGAGFVGKHVVRKLKHKGYTNIFVPRSIDYDLRYPKVCYELAKASSIIIHLAANVGGIGYNRNYPANLFYDNLMLGLNLIHESYRAGVKKFVALGTVCGYPKYTPVPFLEENFWDGYPEETNAPYGLAKKMLLVGCQAYRKQYGFNGIYLIPVNLYGPGDNFNPKQSHVIPALIKKFYEAKVKRLKAVTVWGTGRASREFLFVEDAAEAIILAMEKYDKVDPINLGTGSEITIRNLVKIIASIVEYKGKIIWDKTKPDGQPRRFLNTEKAYREFGFKAKTDLKSGLIKTINWYKNHYDI